MNILFITNGFPQKDNPSNGIFNYHRYKRLKEAGHNVFVCKLNHIRDNRPKERYSLDFLGEPENFVEIVNYYQVPKLNIYFNLVSGLKRIVRENSVDIVHGHFATQAFAAYKLKKSIGIPYVITAHGSGVTSHMRDSIKYATITKKAFKAADHIIYVSNSLKRDAHELGLKSNYESVIYNGVESHGLEINKRENRKVLDRIIYVGSLKDIKRSQYLPEIFEKILIKRPSIKFTIVGDGVNRESIITELEERNIGDKVSFTGNIEQLEVYNYMTSNDLLVLPSLYEGFGCVLVEAMMYGCQVVVSGNGGMPEVVGDVGSIVYDTETWTDNFSDAVISRLDNPIELTALLVRAKKFNWEETVEKEINIYKRIING